MGSATLPIRVLVDAHGLSDASAFRGIGTYLSQMLAGLATQPELSVAALVHGRALSRLPTGVQAVQVRRWAPPRWAQREHDALLPMTLRRYPADVFMSPGQDPPSRCRRPWVQTLHGVLPLIVDHPGLEAERRRWVKLAPRMRRAAAVVAVSRHCADTGIRALGLEPSRVHVVYHGVGAEFSPTPRAPSGTSDAIVPRPPFLLYVGEYGPWKGYKEAFDVVGALAEAGRPMPLKVVGRLAPWVRPAVDALVRAAPRPDLIELLGHVDHEYLPALYRGATVLVMTSRFESFGLPTVEAMASGTPVVAFANSATSEIVGSGGVLVPDGDIRAFTCAVLRVVQDERWRDELSERGLARAQLFDWRRSVELHAEIVRAVA
jgi:glycosyltransferase involved in cell wall biosynthesis